MRPKAPRAAWIAHPGTRLCEPKAAGSCGTFLATFTNCGPKWAEGRDINLPRTRAPGGLGHKQLSLFRSECVSLGLLLSLGWRVAAVTRGGSRLQAAQLPFSAKLM